MRVALLNDSFPPVIDGVANVVVNYAANLHKSGHRPLVAVPDYPGARDQAAHASSYFFWCSRSIPSR